MGPNNYRARSVARVGAVAERAPMSPTSHAPSRRLGNCSSSVFKPVVAHCLDVPSSVRLPISPLASRANLSPLVSNLFPRSRFHSQAPRPSPWPQRKRPPKRARALALGRAGPPPRRERPRSRRRPHPPARSVRATSSQEHQQVQARGGRRGE